MQSLQGSSAEEQSQQYQFNFSLRRKVSNNQTRLEGARREIVGAQEGANTGAQKKFTLISADGRSKGATREPKEKTH